MIKEMRVKSHRYHLKLAEIDAEFIIPLMPEELAGLVPCPV
ncbi:MAG: hypothetical protein OXH79_19460 [Boseongicola sp.]|nr:hypothetical protein [Boseongicola sp.]